MIERWLQITCDNEDCGETANSTSPDMTVAKFLAEEPTWRRLGRKHFCIRCYEALTPDEKRQLRRADMKIVK